MSLERVAALPGATPHIDAVGEYVARAADPEAVMAGLVRLVEARADPWPHVEGWMKLVDAAPIAVDTLVQRPALVAEIPSAAGAFEQAEFERELDRQLAALPSFDAFVDHLRAVRVEETLRIAWQDVVEGTDLTVVTRRISDLADTLMERLLARTIEETTRRFGRPWHGSEPVGVAVVAMGKLGGAELNYSSDIDLVFVYGKDGETDGGESGRSISNREFFHRVTETVSRTANAATPAGKLYRLDLRLRPEGAVGSLARSLASSLAYYARVGETWERQAFLKARVIAGDRAIGDEFVSSVREWAYGRGLDFEEISTLKHLKQRVEDITSTRGEERTEVKLGYGGIRDVEYTIQFLQLMHGAHHRDVRHHNSLTALRLLERAGSILPEERDVLDDAYRFLRLVEHRLQLVSGAQVHNIPAREEDVLALARRCGYDDLASFREAHTTRAEKVRLIFRKLFKDLYRAREEHEVEETNLLLRADADPAAFRGVLVEHGIEDVPHALHIIEELCRETSRWLRGSTRTRNFFADLFPRLLDAIATTPSPDAALRRLERITGSVGARATLYEAMVANDALLHMLVDLAGNSRFLCNILERAPGTLDQLVDAVATETGRGLASFEDIPTAAVPTAPDPGRILADYKNLEMLRIGLRDVRGQLDIRDVGADLTRLAEVIVRLAYERARRDAHTSGAGLVVVALGKFGAGELIYGSDLDLVFFTRDGPSAGAATTIARRLSALLATPGPHGRLYEVDVRLRPGGASGPLVTSPSGFADYFRRGLGQTWERMAWTRARPVAGPPTLCEEIAASIEDTVYAAGFGPEDAAAMAEMRERVAAAGGPESVKRARSGGVVDVEWLAQMHALRHGRDDAQFRIGNVPDLLAALKDGPLHPQAAADLHAAYAFLLSLESKIRIVADLPEDRLPDDHGERRALARRLGYVESGGMAPEAGLEEEYAYHRDIAARAFHRAIEEFGG